MSQQSAIEQHHGATSMISSLWSANHFESETSAWSHAANVLHGATCLAESFPIESELRFLSRIAKQRYAMAEVAQQ